MINPELEKQLKESLEKDGIIPRWGLATWLLSKTFHGDMCNCHECQEWRHTPCARCKVCRINHNKWHQFKEKK